MNKTLIINLKRHGDIFLSGHLVHSYKKQYPNSTISMLVYEDFSKSAEILNHLDNVYTLDKDNILKISASRATSDGAALEAFYKSLEPVLEQKWDRVINLSNDAITANLASFINPKEIVGTFINEHGLPQSSDINALFLNDVTSQNKNIPVHMNDIFHSMCGVRHNNEGLKLKIDKELQKQSLRNFGELRNKLSSEIEKEVFLIGIQLRASVISKEYDQDALCRLIDRVLENEQFLPILLVSPDKEEVTYAKEINKEFNDRLVFVEFDFKASPSICYNLDAIITPDTAIKHLADLTNTPVIEISKGPAPFLLMGTCQTDSIVISRPHYERDYSHENMGEDFNVNDVYNCLNLVLGLREEKDMIFSASNAIYRSRKDAQGLRYQNINLYVDAQEDKYQFSRLYINSILTDHDNTNLIKQVKLLPMQTWISDEKDHITNVSRLLLATLRSLKDLSKGQQYAGRFIQNLDSILSYKAEDSLVMISLYLFKGEVDQISSNTVNENIREFENLLFSLKNNIKNLNNYINAVSLPVQEISHNSKGASL